MPDPVPPAPKLPALEVPGPGDPFARAALWLALLLLGGSVAYWLVALTFGLVSGLVVLMAPLYPLLVQADLTAMGVCLCLWRRAPRAALVVGLAVSLVPPFVLAAWLAREDLACRASADPAACLAYLHGSPLLAVFVGLAVLSGLAQAGLVWVGVGTARRGALRAGTPAPPAAAG